MSFNSILGIGSHSNAAAFFALQETTGTVAVDSKGVLADAVIAGMGANPTTVTGPNTWLPSAFRFDSTDDILRITHDISAYSSLSVGFFVWMSGSILTARLFSHQYSGGDDLRVRRTVTDLDDGSVSSLTYASLGDSTWKHIGLTVGAATSRFCIDGVDADSDSITFDFAGASTNSGLNGFWKGGTTESDFAGMDAAGLLLSPAELSEADWAEVSTGPEPINTTAPSVSGDTAQGSMLTCDPGTWGLDAPFSGGSNGTITYSYQWTRGGVDISGATSSTYTTQAADVGENIGCRVRAMNDGGYDADADTNSSNTITVTSASGNTLTPYYYQMMLAG